MEAILIVGTKVAKGVPLPVVNNTNWQPDAAKEVEAIRSLPGPSKTLRPLRLTISPYFKTSTISEVPALVTQPSDFSSKVVIPPSLFPGEGFSYTGNPSFTFIH